ncbi:ABC-F type ribosomal protection protein [Bacillus sp. H-16]|uniref:ribosomal protection-like ABC-F family protein n=1 Tax=Alteribacter salitolerans TaxID=2912333 RepID=UPI0019636C9E|nr:ABC-F type ribosomal protection protein [Alteribacter salitolerans]MBM7097474.1 ABC-F type ribosomal protection protein [Alteribacter salitolerans]
MLLLKTEPLEKSYGDRIIIKTEKLNIYNGEKIGIVGRNGEGKSTLLKILAGVLQADKGEVHTLSDCAYLPQLEAGQTPVTKKERSKWAVPDGDRRSGGEETRKKIAAVLSTDAQLILADEPTSHLDIEGVEQFEKGILKREGAAVLISHDRELLDRVCTSIWEVENGELLIYEGNYSSYTEQKQLKKERDWFEYEQYTKEKARLTEAKLEKSQRSTALRKAPRRMGNSEARLHKRSVGKKKAKLDKGTKAIQSRIDQLEKKDKPRTESEVTFNMERFTPLHSRTAVAFEDVTVKAASRLLIEKLRAAVKPGEKVAITGCNGAGKSTLLNMIKNRESGVRVAKPAKIGFFYQQLENLDEEKSILENVMETTRYTEEFVRTILARLLFKREEVHKEVSKLSGGERVKTALAKVFLSDVNVLLLDEPTNFLDLPTKEALQEVLSEYPGTILFVTHDRYLIRYLADRVIEIAGKRGIVQEPETLKNPLHTGAEEEEAMTELAIELKLAELLGKLVEAVDEDEKKRLDEEYARMLQKKQQL